MSATGLYVPPMLIFPRCRMKPCLMNNSTSGSIGTCTPSGWINEKTFTQWFDHCLSVVHPQSCKEPVLLMFDGHASHVRNLDIIDKARQNNVILLCLPFHTSHRLQPLGVSFFRSLKGRYAEEVRMWLRNHPGRRLCEENAAALFSCSAYQDAALVRNATNGFHKAGNYNDLP